uniref:FYVE, RhoGEF and PH domain containing 5 n=1 Tax=Cairina moschata TaxID=8855 RepID=A0A8C3GFE5_CAIMO
MLPNETSEETALGLELLEGEPSAENGLGDSTHQVAAEEEKADTDEYNNTNTESASGGCQITERRGEETSEVACEASKDSVKEEEEAVKAENVDDGCQIAPFENYYGEEVPTEHPDENLQTEGNSLNGNGQISDTLPSGPGMEPELEDVPVEEHSERVVETSKSDELQLEDNEVEAKSLRKSVLSSTQQVPYKEELEVCKHSKMNVKHGTKNMLHENLALPEVVIVPEESEERETSSDSLDDPYVLPAENEITRDGQTDSGADHSKRGELGMDGENNLLTIDRKSIVTRTRSLSGKMPGYVPETVPEETGPETDLLPSCNGSGTEDVSNSLFSVEGKTMEANRALPTKSRRFILYPRSYSVEGREIPVSIYKESDGYVLDDGRIKRTEDNLSLPCVNGSSGSFSQGNLSSGVSTPSSVVDIPPPFELAYITKKPITKSSPSLLIENESPDKYSKKKKSSFKRFLTLKFKKKTENKVHVDVNVSSSRSSSESSYHGPLRLLELDRRSLSSSPQLKSHVGKLRASESPSAVLFYKDGKRKGTPKSFSRSVSRVESFEDRSRPSFMPLPLTKPRSISFPNADTSDYENIPAMSSDYENIQIPPRRSTRAGTFTEFFEDPSRALSAANENDGYVDMSSFTGFENKQQTTEQETESAYTEPYKVCPVSVIPVEVVTSDEEQKSSEEEESSQGDPSIIKVLGEDEQEVVELKQGLSELSEIYELHQEILGDLEERVLKWEEHQKVADVFVSRKSRLNHHTAYIIQFDRNLALLDETCHKYSQLATIVQEFEVRPFYYLNNLCPDSTEYESTQAALFIVSEITDRANESMLQGENLQKLVHIEYSVRGQRGLLQPGRPANHIAITDFVFLFIELLVLCWFMSHFHSCSERDDWYSCISRHIPNDYKAHNTSTFHSNVELREKLGITVGERPPTLVPVSHVMMCMNCGCDFTLTLRRHHCHACGKIVCRNCSRNKYPLKYLKDQAAKVCDSCYMELKKRGKVPSFLRGCIMIGLQKKSPQADKVATESLPLLGFTIAPEKEEGSTDTVFHLYHKQTLFYSFRAEDNNSAQRYGDRLPCLAVCRCKSFSRVFLSFT